MLGIPRVFAGSGAIGKGAELQAIGNFPRCQQVECAMSTLPDNIIALASAGQTKTETPARLFTLAQIQQAGNASRSTLYRWRHGGGLRVVTVGGVTRVRESDWLAFLDKHATGTGEIAP